MTIIDTSTNSEARVPTPIVVPVNHVERPEKFNGLNFKMWQQKMMFYLTTLNLASFLTEDPPAAGDDRDSLMTLDVWKSSDYSCRNLVLNSLVDSLYNVYIVKKTAKELWKSLEKKYKTEDAGSKKFVVGQFLDYQMVDSKTVISQVQEIQIILHEIHSEGVVVSEAFQVAAIIEKLPPAWKDFKNYLKNKRKEMNVEELIVRLRIEEDNKHSEKRVLFDYEAKANMLEHKNSSKFKKPSEDLVDDHVNVIVAALIATVTFTAGLTVPGGFVSEEGPLEGTPILGRNSAFMTFMVMNTIAMVLSTSSVLTYLFMNTNFCPDLAFPANSSIVLTTWAMVAVVVAFAAGTYALGYSTVIWVLALSFFILFVYLVVKCCCKK